MIRLAFTNDKNVDLLLSQLSQYVVTNIEGIDDVDHSVITDRVSQHYGGLYRGWKTNDREITIDVVIRGNIEVNRLALITYFRSADNYRLFLQTGSGRRYIDGQISKVDYSLFTNKETVKITMVCPFPYFTSVADTNAYTVGNAVTEFIFSGLSLPFSKAADVNCLGINQAWLSGTPELDITNIASDVNLGFVFICSCRGALILTNDTTGQYMQFNTANGDKLMVDTRNGTRSVWLLHNYAYDNAVELIQPGSSWLQLQGGSNHLRFTTSIGSEFKACLRWSSGLKAGM